VDCSASSRPRAPAARALACGRSSVDLLQHERGLGSASTGRRACSARARAAGAQAPFELCRSASRCPGCRPRGLLRARRPRRLVARSPSPPASLLQGACRVRAAHPREYMAGPITALCRSPAALIAPAWSRSCGLEQKKQRTETMVGSS